MYYQYLDSDNFLLASSQYQHNFYLLSNTRPTLNSVGSAKSALLYSRKLTTI